MNVSIWCGRKINRILKILGLQVVRRSGLVALERALTDAVADADAGRNQLAARRNDPATLEQVVKEEQKMGDDLDYIKEKISSVRWYHSFEIVPGIITPGQSPMPTKQYLDGLGVPKDLSGKTAIDIGTWDGPVAFELEARGASVTALDIQDRTKTGFNVAKEILKSNVEYIQASVYDLPNVVKHKYDIVMFLGVFYHLKHPILAFEQISKILADDGLLFFEGEALRSYAETLSGDRSSKVNIESIANSDIPLTLCYPGCYKAASNWFVPNLACVKGWMLAAGLEITRHSFYEKPDEKPYPGQRISGISKKVKGITEEHPLVGINMW